MAPRRINEVSSDDSDDDAPEFFSLGQSKLQIQQQDSDLQKFAAAEKAKKRARNQERDRRLKEQAEKSKKRRKEEEEVLDAQVDEDEDEDEDLDEGGSEKGTEDDDEDDNEDEFKGIDGSGGGEDEDDDDDDLEEDESDVEMEFSTDEPSIPKRKTNPNHLPDHLFESAFATQDQPRKSDAQPKPRTRKRARKTKGPKDVIIGSRAIRALPNSSLPRSGKATIPSKKVQKFLDRTLALKGGNSKLRGWERRPVNIGTMKRDGPAAGFVRSR